MAHRTSRARLTLSALCTALFFVSVSLIAACSDAVRPPTEPRQLGIHRLDGQGGCNAENDPDMEQCLECEVDPTTCGGSGYGNGPPPGPLSSQQQAALSSALAIRVTVSDTSCAQLVGYLQTLPYSGGAFVFDPNESGYGVTSRTDFGWMFPIPDYGATITFTNRAFQNQFQLARTAIHEASHGLWNTDDDVPVANNPASSWYWEQRCVP